MQEHEQEINLSDYLKVILKRKKTILLIFLATTIAAAIISFLMPKSYEISMVVEGSPLAGETLYGSKIYMDSPQNTEVKIKEGVFNLTILRKLNMDPSVEKLRFKVIQPKNTRLVKVSMEEPKDKIQQSKNILNTLFLELSNEYQPYMDSITEVLEKDISTISSGIKLEKENIASYQNELAGIREKEKNILDKFEKIKLTSKSTQNSETYLAALNSVLSNLRIHRSELEQKIKSIREKIQDLEKEIRKVNLKQAQMQNIKLLQKPQVSPSSVQSSRRQNVTVAGILGLFLGIFVAFFQEFWEKEMKK